MAAGRVVLLKWITAAALIGAASIGALAANAAEPAAPAKKPPTVADVLAAAKPADWHAMDPASTLYLEFAAGRVVIELAPQFAPRHVENIKTLVHEKYFDGLEFLRSQDNYVVQWGDPSADARSGDKDQPRSFGSAQHKLKAEFTIPLTKQLAFTPMPDRDGYAPQTGYSGDFPAARDEKAKSAWLAHCYGTLGVGRDNDVDSGSGAELYVAIASAPRWLDRNITVVGRVVQGMELLSVLPRGTGVLGFYEKPEQRTAIKSIRLAADVPAAERTNLEIMRTDTATFASLIEARRNRRDDFYKTPAGFIDVCSVPIPVRVADAKAK